MRWPERSAGTDTTTTPSFPWILLALVLDVGHMRPPMGSALSDGQVRHEVIGRGAVPVFLVVGCEDDIAGIKFDDVLPAHLDQAMAFGDIQGLPAVMGMPRAARSGCEADRGDVQLRGWQAPGDGVDPDVTGKGFGRPFAVAALREISMHASPMSGRRPTSLTWVRDRSLGGKFPEEVGSCDATVHEEVTSRDEGSIGTHEERADGADLVRRPSAPDRR
jgi:hypothetical protein